MVIIHKRTILAALAHFIVWVLVAGIANAIMGDFFQKTTAGAIIWELLNVGSFILFVIVPAVQTNKDSVEEFAKNKQAEQITFLNPNRSEGAISATTVSPETIAVRNKYIADINACVAGTIYLWQWAHDATINQVILYNPSGPFTDRGLGILEIVNGRVEHIAFKRQQDGFTAKFPNYPLIEARREESMRIDTPVAKFMEGAIPDAKWYWLNAETKTICVSSKKRGFHNATATLKYQPGGYISSINVEVSAGQFKRVFAKKSSDATEENSRTVETPTVSVATAKKSRSNRADIKGRTNVSSTRCTIVATESVAPPVDVLLPETEANLLQPTDTPPVDDDRLKQAAMLIADDDAMELNDLAMAAEENGDASFVKKWTEGLQTMKEVEYYCDAILKSGVFSRVEINAENQTIRFFLHSTQDI